MTAIFAVTFVMSAVLICKWTLSHYDDDDDDDEVKIWEKMERGPIQELPKFFEYPLLSQERVKLRTSNLAGIFTRSMRTKAL